MDSGLLSDILYNLRRYLSHEISLDGFREWFDTETWDVIDSSSPATQQVYGEIELRIAELTNGHLTEDELRNLLHPLVARAKLTTGTLNETIFPSPEVPVTFGNQASAEFVLEAVAHH